MLQCSIVNNTKIYGLRGQALFELLHRVNRPPTAEPGVRERPVLQHPTSGARLDFFPGASYGLLFLRKTRVDKLPEVEAAKALMTEAMTWSVMKWLREKKRVRKTADRADAVLDQLSASVKTQWTDGLRTAYEALVAQASVARNELKQQRGAQSLDPEATRIAKKIKEADDEAYRARMDAEKTFDEAEIQLSTSLAREGCRKAIHGWELHEKAIRKAEAAIRPN